MVEALASSRGRGVQTASKPIREENCASALASLAQR